MYLLGERPTNLDDLGLGSVGLSIPPERLFAISGNHDHWDGHIVPPQRCHNANLFPTEFTTMPWRRVIVSPKRSVALDLFGVDSNSGLQGVAGRHNQSMARGMISAPHLIALSIKLKMAPEANEKAVARKRAILVHHTYSIPLGSAQSQTLQPPSAVTLLQQAALNQVDAFLTGHAHIQRIDYLYAPGVNPPRAVWELRAPTALQAPAQAGVQGFLVHQIYLDDDQQAKWDVWPFVYSNSGFVCVSPVPMESI